MHRAKKVFQWYIQASIHVSLALMALLAFTAQVLEVAVSRHYYTALFFGGIAAYNGIKYGLERGKHTYRIPGGLRLLIPFSLACGVFALYHLFFLPAYVWLLAMACGVLTAMYALPVMPGMRNLRSMGLLKIFIVALVWTIATVWIPVWGLPNLPAWDVHVESFQRLLWVFLLMLPFEIRDMKVDPPAIRTIPRRLGIRKTRRIAWLGVMVFVASTFLKDNLVQGEFLTKAVTGLLMGLAVANAAEDQPGYYASFWVEGIPVVSLMLLILFGAVL